MDTDTTPKETPTMGGNHMAGGAGTSIVTAGTEHGKAFTALQAQLAMKGHWLHALQDGGFLVGAWHFSRTLPDLEAVRAFLVKVGGGG